MQRCAPELVKGISTPDFVKGKKRRRGKGYMIVISLLSYWPIKGFFFNEC